MTGILYSATSTDSSAWTLDYGLWFAHYDSFWTFLTLIPRHILP